MEAVLFTKGTFSEVSSPIKKENAFSNRTKDFRNNLKGKVRKGVQLFIG
jgi:hypothetical protein